jgi:hypothetical protein
MTCNLSSQDCAGIVEAIPYSAGGGRPSVQRSASGWPALSELRVIRPERWNAERSGVIRSYGRPESGATGANKVPGFWRSILKVTEPQWLRFVTLLR